jgi:hypothetical protein
MGTRGTYGFRVGEEDKLTYNHFDSYPDGLGRPMLDFIKQTTDEQLREIATGLIMVDENVPASPDQIAECGQYFDEAVGSRMSSDWYGLLRNAQGEPMEYTKGLKYMIENNGFAYDSLFCEYGYIVNLDKGVLEFYEGFNKDVNAAGRYAMTEVTDDRPYAGIVHIKDYSFDEIRSSTIDAIIEDMQKMIADEEDE